MYGIVWYGLEMIPSFYSIHIHIQSQSEWKQKLKQQQQQQQHCFSLLLCDGWIGHEEKISTQLEGFEHPVTAG